MFNQSHILHFTSVNSLRQSPFLKQHSDKYECCHCSLLEYVRWENTY